MTTSAVDPLGVMAMATGSLPTAMAVPWVLVAVVTGVTEMCIRDRGPVGGAQLVAGPGGVDLTTGEAGHPVGLAGLGTAGQGPWAA